MRHGYTREQMIADRMDALGISREVAELPMHEIVRDHVRPPITERLGHRLVAAYRQVRRFYKGDA